MSRKDKKRPQVVQPAAPEPAALWVLWAIGVVWALVVCFFFYQKQPFSYFTILNEIFSPNTSLPNFSTLFNDLKGIAGFFILAGAAFFVGRLMLVRFKAWGSSLEWFVFSTALGYGTLAYGALGLAALGFLYKGPIRIGLFVLFAAGFLWSCIPDEKQKLKTLLSELRQSLFPGGAGSWFGALLLFVLATDFVMAFVPELFYDALVYHLGAPNFYLQEHRLSPLYLMTAKFPLTVQMIHLLGLALKDEMVTKLTHLFLMTLIIGGTLALGLRFKRRLFGVLAALLFCTIPTAQFNVWTSGVDLGVSLFGFMAFLAFFFAFESEEPVFSWFLLSAVFAGLIAASKYTAAYVPASIGLTTLVLIAMKRVPFPRGFGWLVVFSVVVAAIVVPWLIKNWFETGNPVYPFLSRIFGGESLAPWRYEILRNENYGVTPKNLFGIPKMLWDLSISERSSLSFQGPGFLACLPFAFGALFKERPRSFRTLCLYALIVCTLGLTMTRLTRYVLPAFAVAACFIAFGVEEYLTHGSYFRRFGVLFVVLLCLLQQISWAYIFIANSYQPQNVLLGRESRFDYVNRYHTGMNPDPSNQMYVYMEKTFTPDNKVLLVGEEKAYPLQVRHTYSGVYDRGVLVRLCEESSTPDEVAAKLLDQGITHIMVNMFEANRIAGYGNLSMTPKAYGLLCAFWETHLKFSHLELHSESKNDKNPIVLLEVVRGALGPNDRTVQNLLAPVFERNEMPRLGLGNSEAMRSFYQERQKEWPHILFFKSRLQELSAK